EQLLAFVGAPSRKTPVIGRLEDQVPASGHGATADASAAITAPDQHVFHRIPGLQAAADPVRRRWTDGRRLDLARFSGCAYIAVATFLVFVGRLVGVGRVGRGNVDQPGSRIK